MNVIITGKKETSDSSLLLTTLTEDDTCQAFRIPGILKSKKRNAFHYFAGTIWSFTLSGTEKDVIIPRETALEHSPIEINASYEELNQLAELLIPAGTMVAGLVLEDLYIQTRNTLKVWPYATADGRNEMLNAYYLEFLEKNGFIGYDTICSICDVELTKNDFFTASEGVICQACISSRLELRSQAIPFGWFQYYIRTYIEKFQKHFEKINSEHKSLEEFDTEINYNKLYDSENFKKSSEYRKILKSVFLD